jgi:hypothetical protein
LAEAEWPVHAPARITELTFANALIEGPRVFKGVDEIGTIWKTLMKHGVDPSFALGHFWVESNFGTAGWNVWSEPKLYSWGNVLYPNSSLKGTPGVTEYSASNGYHYTAYPDWTTGVEDYCLLLNQYRDQAPDYRYGDTSTIYGATAKWPAKTPGSDGHLKYLDIVLGRMTRYDIRPDWEGELTLYTPGTTYNSNKRYAIKAGDRWYLKPGGSTSYAFKADGSAVFLGQVSGTSWFAIRVSTARLSNDGVTRFVVGYVPAFDSKRLKTL